MVQPLFQFLTLLVAIVAVLVCVVLVGMLVFQLLLHLACMLFHPFSILPVPFPAQLLDFRPQFIQHTFYLLAVCLLGLPFHLFLELFCLLEPPSLD